MKWYSKYLSAFEKPFNEVPQQVVKGVGERLNSLQSQDPVASVVVIAHNEESRLFSCLWSLSETKSKYPIEIIGVDNNSSDGTASIYEAVGLPYYKEDSQSCGYARNRGLSEAKGKYYICIDSDTMYPPHYVERLVDVLQKPGVVAVSSSWSYVPSKEYPRYIMKIYESVRDFHLWVQSFKRPELSVRGMVFAYITEYGRNVGYRVRIIRGEDGAMAMGLKKYGKIKFLRRADARAVTSTSTISSDGSVFRAFYVRIKKAILGMGRYFTKREVYKDQESNLIK